MNKMRKIFVLLTTLILAACVSAPLSQMNAPSQIAHNGIAYQLAAQQDLGNIARYVYLPPQETLANWQSEIELLFDRNLTHQTINDRIALREKVYRNIGVKHFQLTREKNELQGFVIYEPTEQNPTWQVDMARGVNLTHCGFIQYQYSRKIMRNNKSISLKPEKVAQHLQKYIVDKEFPLLKKMEWQWKCENLSEI